MASFDAETNGFPRIHNISSNAFLLQDDISEKLDLSEQDFVPSQLASNSPQQADDFKSFLKSYSDNILTIKEAVDFRTPENEFTSIQCLYCIIHCVHHTNNTNFKHLLVVDPTYHNGISINCKKYVKKLSVGWILKILNLKVSTSGGQNEFFLGTDTVLSFFPLFSYDYSKPDADERNILLTQKHFNDKIDTAICEKLEEWFSKKLIESNGLENLPSLKSYVNICCQVLAYSKSPLCISALIWDGTNPKYSIPKCFYNDPGLNKPIHFDAFNYEYYPFALNRYSLLTIWKNDNKKSDEHYDVVSSINLRSGNDLLVLFNLQLVGDQDDPISCNLVMRSSMRYGKAIRICSRNSILGKLLMNRINNKINDIKIRLSMVMGSNITSSEMDFILNNNTNSILNIQEATKNQKNEDNLDKEEVSDLENLKGKGKPLIVYDSLLKMGLTKLKEYYKLLEEEFDKSDSDEEYDHNFLTKEEKMRLTKYAIIELSKHELSPALQDQSQIHDSLMSDDLTDHWYKY